MRPCQLPIAFILIACCAAEAPAAMAQTSPDHVTAQPAAPNPAVMHPMEFYDAHGEANACGLGCSEWIAAQGKIDNGTADRLQRLLARLKGARLPIFFQSPGGLVTGSISLGELIRARKLTVSVGTTVPLNCDRDPTSQNSCDAEIRAGHPIEAKLDFPTAMCNSGCVYALAGGVVRLIPPWVTLGIHDVGIDAATRLAIEVGNAVTDDRLHSYIHLMGIGDGLLSEAFATPFSSLRRLSRDDAARFGLDRREFGETVWQFVGKPRPSIRKTFFVRADADERRYINAIVSVFCAPWHRASAIAVFAREHLSADTGDSAFQSAVSISVNGQDIRLARAISTKFYERSGELPIKILDAASDDATVVLPGTELGRQQGPAGDVTLAMIGFSAAYAKLQKACAAETVQAQSAQAVSPMPALASPLQSPFSARMLPPLRSASVTIGTTRGAVDAVLVRRRKCSAPRRSTNISRRPARTK